jgi:serine phosphatase RsbU (regulator of sigma subunit)
VGRRSKATISLGHGLVWLLGVAEGMDYPAASVDLKPGSVLLLYTDGITEAFNEQDEEFGLARLTAIVEKEGLL